MLAAATFAVCAPLAASAADIAADMLKEARAAIQRGDLNAAKAKLETVRGMDPKNPAAAAMLRDIAQQQNGGGGTEATLSRLIVPRVEFKEAQLSAVLPALRQQAERLTDGKVVPNFVSQVPEDQSNSTVTLTLRNIPYTELLRYIGNLTNVSFTYDKYAILVRPVSGAKSEPAPTEAVK